MIFLRFIRVATELWGRRSTADTKTMKMPMIVMARKNCAPKVEIKLLFLGIAKFITTN